MRDQTNRVNREPTRDIANLKMNSPAAYEIKVGGNLSERWAQWFNGTLSDYREVVDGKPQTNLICQVRDQAELLGILRQLNALNLPLIEVCLLHRFEPE